MKITQFWFLSLVLLFQVIANQNNTLSQLGHSNMTLLANKNDHPPASGGLYSAIWGYRAPNGREYAIMGCRNGTAFYDVTNNANIVEVDFIPGSNNNWREMKVYSHYAYIVSELSSSRLLIVDLQYLPDSVSVVRTWTFPNYSRTHSIQQDGPYLYLNGGNVTQGMSDEGGIAIVDLTSNPSNPTLRGKWGNEYVHDCRVRNDTIWAANIYDPPGTISVINASNKDNPTTITSWVNNPNPFPHNIALTPGRTFALTTDETSSPQPNGKLKVWNISNLNNVTLVTTWMPTGITTSVVHNVEIYGNYAIVAHYSAGVRILNISNPAVPVEVAWYDTYPSNNGNNYDGCWGVFLLPSGKIIASDRQTGLYVLTTTIPVSINNTGSNVPSSFELKQNYPNPFNPNTSIEYNITKSSFVTLKVFDVLGRQVALLADDYKTAGNYKVTFDAAKLSSGIYYYSLTTDNGFSETKKMVLNK
jgi:choice-of-anchor B domain-containing protein